MKRVLVTGGRGFLGKHVCHYLENEQWVSKVHALGKEDYDLCEQADVNKMYEDIKPDVVIHLAALAGGIGANREHPARFYYENMIMGTQTLHGAYIYGVQKFVAVGTVCAYPKFTPVPFQERDLWNGYPEETNAPYGLAKKMLLVQAQAYREEYGFNAIYLLPANLYGPGDNFEFQTSHVIPALMCKFADAVEQGEQIVRLWGDGSPTREFLYVEDAAEALILATKHYNESYPVNIGTGQSVSIADLATLISSKMGFEGTIEWDAMQPNGQPNRQLNVDLAKQCFGFHAHTTLNEGIDKTIVWYKQNRDTLRKLHIVH